MPILNQPSITPTNFNFAQNGLGNLGRSNSSSSSESISQPILLKPDADLVRGDYQNLQGQIQPNQLQNQALGVQENLGNTLRGLLSDADAQGRARITQGFNQAAGQAANDVASRGTMSADRLNADAQLAASRASGLEIGDLVDQLLGRGVKAETDIANNISEILFGSSEQATDLINALLGSGGIGNISQSKSLSESSTINSL